MQFLFSSLLCSPELTALFSGAASVPVPDKAALGERGKAVKNKELMVKPEGLAGKPRSRLGPSERFYQASQIGRDFLILVVEKHTLKHKDGPYKNPKTLARAHKSCLCLSSSLLEEPQESFWVGAGLR